jgi:hypothetical protein
MGRHSVEMLMRVYARCVAGWEDVWIARMDATLRPPDGQSGSASEDRPERGAARATDGEARNRTGVREERK